MSFEFFLGTKWRNIFADAASVARVQTWFRRESKHQGRLRAAHGRIRERGRPAENARIAGVFPFP
jgi:hypothetical protein